MNRTFLALLLCSQLLGPLDAVASALYSLPLKLTENERVGAAAVRDDGSGVIVVTSNRPRVSTILRFANGKQEKFPLQGISINRAVPLDRPNRLFVAGAIGSGAEAQYVGRVIELRPNGAVRTVWSSEGSGETTGRQMPTIAVDASGEVWALLTRERKGFRLVMGRTGDGSVLSSHDVSLQFSGDLPNGYAGDTFDARVIGSDKEPIAAVTNRGRIYILAPGQEGFRAVLQPPTGVSTSEWDHTTSTLWVEAGGQWSEFNLSSLIRGDKPEQLARRPHNQNALRNRSGDSLRGFAGRQGRFVLQTRSNDVVSLQLFEGAETMPRHLAIEGASAFALVNVSPSGEYAVILPSGPRSTEVRVIALR